MYHYVRDKDEDLSNLKALSIEKFERQLDYLQRNYSIISWPGLRDFLMSDKKLPDNPCLLTFDDGLKDGYINVYPRLKERGISGLFFPLARSPAEGLALVHLLQLVLAKTNEQEFRELFLNELASAERELFEGYCKQSEREYPPDKFGEHTLRNMRRAITIYMPDKSFPVLRKLFGKLIGDDMAMASEFYLQKNEIEEMIDGGMFFGGHGAKHFRFSKIPVEDQRVEVEGSAKFLENLHPAPWAFAYPYGDYNDQSFQLLKNNNFIGAFSTEEKEIHNNVYGIGRVDTVSI